MASLEREGICRSDRLFPALGQGLLHISEPVKGVTLGKNSERGFDIWKSLLERELLREGGEAWVLSPLPSEAFPFPKSFMSSACPVPFAPEQADNLLRSRAAALRADDERREGDDGRGHDGVDAAHARVEDAEGEEAGDSRHDGGDRAGGVGFLPVEAEDDRPTENGLKPAESEEVDPDQQIRRFDGGGANDESDDGGPAEAHGEAQRIREIAASRHAPAGDDIHAPHRPADQNRNQTIQKRAIAGRIGQ